MKGEQDQTIECKQYVEELLQDLMESLTPTSSESDSDGHSKDLETNQIKLIYWRKKYTRTTRKLVNLDKPADRVQLDIDLLNFIGVLKLCDLLNAILKSPAFQEKLNICPSNLEDFSGGPVDELSSWSLVTQADLPRVENLESYVVVTRKDIEEGIAYYTATYLSTLKEIKEMTPEQLRKALEKTFSLTKNKGKLHKLWEGSKTVYNIASHGATAVGTYGNPAVSRAASAALSMPWRMISKLRST